MLLLCRKPLRQVAHPVDDGRATDVADRAADSQQADGIPNAGNLTQEAVGRRIGGFEQHDRRFGIDGNVAAHVIDGNPVHGSLKIADQSHDQLREDRQLDLAFDKRAGTFGNQVSVLRRPNQDLPGEMRQVLGGLVGACERDGAQRVRFLPQHLDVRAKHDHRNANEGRPHLLHDFHARDKALDVVVDDQQLDQLRGNQFREENRALDIHGRDAHILAAWQPRPATPIDRA